MTEISAPPGSICKKHQRMFTLSMPCEQCRIEELEADNAKLLGIIDVIVNAYPQIEDLVYKELQALKEET